LGVSSELLLIPGLIVLAVMVGLFAGRSGLPDGCGESLEVPKSPCTVLGHFRHEKSKSEYRNPKHISE